MKRLLITIDEDVYAELGREAAEEGRLEGRAHPSIRPRAAHTLPPIKEDPLCGLVGAYSGSSADDIDEVVYGAKDP